MFRRPALGLVCAALVFSALGGHHAQAKPASATASAAASKASRPYSFSIEPIPSWVVPAQDSPTARVDPGPMHFRVIDDQTRVDDKSVVRYSRVVRVIDSAAGLNDTAQIQLWFDPSYQTLVMHHVDIIRNGKRIKRLDRSKVQLLQRETQLENLMYDGQVTASIVLSDVRVGDEIDFASSIRGDNPVFGGRFVDTQLMSAFRGPSAVYQFRLLAPAARKIVYRAGPAAIQVSDRTEQGMRELVFRRESVPMARFDTGAPYSALVAQEIQFSEFSDWADVARWGTGLFQSSAQTGAAALDSKAAELRAVSPDPEQQLLAALRFVQTEVRYFGTETGLNSHQPEAPGKILEQRFGDCKDKVGLFVALLARLDIPASPVLVSTSLRGRVDGLLPSPLAFNHVIARVDFKGRSYWLDPTRTHQTGTLANRQSIGFLRGLTLKAGSSGLDALPSPYDQERASVHDLFRISRLAEPARLESRATYRGELADAVRQSIASKGLPDVETQMSQPYVRAYPKLTVLAPMQVETSQTDDAVTLVQTFSVPDLWRFPEQRALIGDVVHWLLIDAIRPPSEATRRDALSLSYPGIQRQITTVEYGEDVHSSAAVDDAPAGDSMFTVSSSFRTEPRRAEIRSELRLLNDEIPAERFGAYRAQFNKLAPKLGYGIRAPAIGAPRQEQLRRDLAAAQEGLKSGRLKLTTSAQVDATAKAMALTAALDEGRLNPTLRAEALTARGILYDQLGRSDAGREDFAQALALSPDLPEAVNASIGNAVIRGDYREAIQWANRWLKDHPGEAEARQNRALARTYSNDYTGARTDLEELLKDGSQARRGFPLLWLGIVAERQGEDAGKALSRFGEAELPPAWPRPLVNWMRGTSKLDDAVDEAVKGDQSKERLTEVYYYAAERLLAAGLNAKAREYFGMVVKLNVVEYVEHAAAVRRLALLGS